MGAATRACARSTGGQDGALAARPIQIRAGHVAGGRAHPSGLGLGRGAEGRGPFRWVSHGGLIMRNQTASIIGAVGIGLVVGACSSGSSTTGSSSASTSPASSKAAAAPATTQASSPAAAGQASGTATVSLASISGIPDKVLVGSNGRTMYLFGGDKSGASAGSVRA